MKKWLVELETGEEYVEADDVEIAVSGVLAFYRSVSRREREQLLVKAFSPGLWRRCQLESPD